MPLSPGKGTLRRVVKRKYFNKPVIIDGIRFHSKREAAYYQDLRAKMASGEVANLELQPRFKFPMGFSYIADFRITWADGRIEIVDVKGFETPEFKLKKKCFAHFYPEYRLSIWK